jgi:hypothetical protein
MKKLFIISLLVLTACNAQVKSSKDAASRITYFKDERTGLCFGQVVSSTADGWVVTSITTVPCEKVDSLILK